ncbi:MAG TPA: hypothetical protein VN660_09070 [Steroidobacteraceae bacterium]|nr:hypothetical protein [Steroidobacteraceae bacterium]
MSALIWSAALAVSVGHAAELPAAPATGSASIAALPRPSVEPVRIDSADAPTIDGDLSDPVWDRAAIIDRFYRITPTAGATPSERTEVRLLYDQDALFIAIHCYDDPTKIIDTDKSHDGFAPSGDFVRVDLDPKLTRRDGYGFEITPLGGYGDAILQNNTDFLIHWNLVWLAKARITADGWTAEMEIPFRELSFDPRQTTWGLDVIRQIKRNAETDGWAPTASSLSANDVSVAGTMTGMHGLSQGVGLDVQLYGVAKLAHSTEPYGQTATTLSPSGNFFYKITPSLTGTLTFNTDFSDAPLDQRQLNTSRFALFQPEVRQFFLQDAAQFQFGGLTFEDLNPGGPSRQTTDNNGEPFFSRRIGLVEGEQVGVLGGAKVSGDILGVRVGALSVRTKEGLGVPAQTLSAARLAAPLGPGLEVGLIGTQGDPTGLSRNQLVGTDVSYLNTDIGSGQQLRASSFFERTASSLVGADTAYGGSLYLPNDPWSGDIDFKQIGAQFAPALGFANRLGIRQYTAQFNHRTHLAHSELNWYELGAGGFYITGLQGVLQSRTISGSGDLFNRAGDELDVHVLDRLENIPEPFILPGGVNVPAGRYRWVYLNPHLSSSQARPLSVTLDLNCCRIYGGRYLNTDVTFDYRPNGTYEFSVEDNRLHLQLPGGRATVHAINTSVTVNFTADMQLSTQLQYDNISDHFDLLGLFAWQYSPGQTVLVSVGEDALVNGSLLAPAGSPRTMDVLIRLGRTLQF